MTHNQCAIELFKKYSTKTPEEIQRIEERLEKIKQKEEEDKKAIQVLKTRSKRAGLIISGIQFASVKSAAKHYGVHVSTIYRWAKEKPLMCCFITLEQLLNKKDK